MEGVQSFEQRSSGEYEAIRKNRVIIVNRRDPSLSWPTTGGGGGGGAQQYGLNSSCCFRCSTCIAFCCGPCLWCCCCAARDSGVSLNGEKSVSRGRGVKRKVVVDHSPSNSNSNSESNSRKLTDSINDSAASFDFGPFQSNEWKTSKYTLLNFLPKNLFEQFRRLANFYFLITALLQILIPLSPVGAATSLIPLAFVVSTTAIKQAYEDYLRHKLDREINDRICYILKEDKSLVKVRSKDIRVGDVVYVKNNEEIPCDMILLATSGAGDRCYITTANLDGETSLKSRTCFQIRQQIGSIDRVNETLLVLECEKPNATLYEFNGSLRAPKDAAAYDKLMKDLKQFHMDPLIRNFRDSFAYATSLKSTAPSQVSSINPIQLNANRLSFVTSILKRMKRARFVRSSSKLNKHLTLEPLNKAIAAPTTTIIRDNNSREQSPDHNTLDNEYADVPLDISNLLLRASRLRNTSHIYGLAIYTGQDTRLAHNSHVKPNKFSSLESRVNLFLVIAFLILLTLTLISALKFEQPNYWYMSGLERANSFLEIFMAHFVLYNYLVPISLYVTLEFVKFLGTISVIEDKKLHAVVWSTNNNQQEKSLASKSKPKQASSSAQQRCKILVGPQCNTSDLNEDLGQVEVLFSDKTGTLTENKMHFMACSINGHLFRSISSQLYEQPEGLCYVPSLNVANKMAAISSNRYAAIADELSKSHQPKSVPKSASSSSRSSKSSLDRLSKLPLNQRPFDHRLTPQLKDLKLIDNLERHSNVAEFLICLCLCSTITINEQKSLEDCLVDCASERLNYESASPDEESLISAAALFGVFICKSSERECYIAIKRKSSSSSLSSSSTSPSTPRALSPGGSQTKGKENAKRGGGSATGSPPPTKQSKPPGSDSARGQFRATVETKNSTDKYFVRHFERLVTFEFNSIRKKMSVLYRDSDNNCNILITKGSESVLDCIAIPDQSPEAERTINTIMAHFESFSKSGLRTMLVARRLVDQREYNMIVSEMRSARLMPTHGDRDDKLATLYRRAECNMSLVGATAVEDCLQDGVPETIAELKEAGIKVWLLTGDKVETAISVAYLCKLLDRNMNLLQLVRQQDSRSCQQLLVSFVQRIKTILMYGDPDDESAAFNWSTSDRSLQQKESLSKRPKAFVQAAKMRQYKSAGPGSSPGKSGGSSSINSKASSSVEASLANEQDMPRFALVSDGRSLHYAMKYAKQELEFVCNNCVCVIGCRLSPLQKAEIVAMIKNSANEPITAAIGDGANDVSMIQEAHVGIGISGKEGRQAVNSSDFAINRFHMLNRLFFVHGHLFYHRTANTIHYFFYKNVLFITPQFLYSFYNLSSATSLYHPTMLISFNMMFTSIPILLYGLFEINIPVPLLETYPRLYRLNRCNEKMRLSVFLWWLLLGFIQGTIAFYSIMLIWGSHTPFLETGKMGGIIGFALILFSTIVLVATMKLYFMSMKRSYKFDLVSLLSCLMLPAMFYLISLLDLSLVFYDNSLYRQFYVFLQSPMYWLAILSTTSAVVIPDIIMYVRDQIHYYKTLNSIIKQS